MTKGAKKSSRRDAALEHGLEITSPARDAVVDERKVRARTRLAHAVALIERRLHSARESFYDIGVALKEIRDDKLYLEDEPACSDFDELLRRRAWFHRSYAQSLMEIAAAYDRETALALGTGKAAELLRYASTIGDRKEANRLAAIGTIEGKKLEDLDIEDLRDLRRKRNKKKRPIGEDEREARSRARAFDDWLTDHGLPGAVVKAIEEDDEWSVDARVPVAVLNRFFGSAPITTDAAGAAAPKPAPTKKRKRPASRAATLRKTPSSNEP